MRHWTTSAAVALSLLAAPVGAATLRVGVIGDAGTMDPHSQNVQTTSQLLRQIYEPLVNRGPAILGQGTLLDLGSSRLGCGSERDGKDGCANDRV